MRFLLVTLLFLASYLDAQENSIHNYESQKLRGWTLQVRKTLLKNEPLWSEVKEVLDLQFLRIIRNVPNKHLKFFRSVTIFVEDDFGKGACYHPSSEWLKANNYIPEKHRTIEISNAKNFVQWTKSQPWMILHELAHAYHHQVLTFRQKELLKIFHKAQAKKHYEKVLHISGRTQRHYALNDHKEYFAEATEAYFGRNDFYPFVRPELKQHDPELFEFLKKVWE
ncbi:MAG: hypothetical protein MK132_02325 [Lentisphaerales bacterium]|nr:hypothetical protein [Lentisphaerales bacterium]